MEKYLAISVPRELFNLVECWYFYSLTFATIKKSDHFNSVFGKQLVALPVSTWSQVQGWLKSEKVGNLKIAYAMLIKSEVLREWLCEYSVL